MVEGGIEKLCFEMTVFGVQSNHQLHTSPCVHPHTHLVILTQRLNLTDRLHELKVVHVAGTKGKVSFPIYLLQGWRDEDNENRGDNHDGGKYTICFGIYIKHTHIYTCRVSYTHTHILGFTHTHTHSPRPPLGIYMCFCGEHAAFMWLHNRSLHIATFV